jgi:hypothetical protein
MTKVIEMDEVVEEVAREEKAAESKVDPVCEDAQEGLSEAGKRILTKSPLARDLVKKQTDN